MGRKLTVIWDNTAPPRADYEIWMAVDDAYRLMRDTQLDASVRTSNSVMFYYVRAQVRAGYIVGIDVEFQSGEKTCLVDKHGRMHPHPVPHSTLVGRSLNTLGGQSFADRIGDKE